jgi:glutamate synthase (NADPH) small chain
MPTPELDAFTSKYAWRIRDRESPPKRTAPERVGDFQEVYADLDAATAMAQAERCIQCPDPLCARECPLSNRIPEWLRLTALGDFLGAASVSRETSNLPEVCSRICPQERLCEGGCILNARGEPVTIGAIERFINEYAFQHGAVEAVSSVPNGRQVAVVGSGPGGLACADQLAQLGYAVTVFESQLIPGGLLVNGIPAFKLEKSVVERRIDLLAKRGIVFRLGMQIGRDLSFAEIRRSHDAVFLAFGAQKPKPADLPGETARGVHAALPFLIQKNVDSELVEGPPIDVRGKRVAVLGGGDTAMDCLRTAVRAGAARSVCLYRRDRANMPGSEKEYANALEEGAEFEFLTNPVEIVADESGAVSGVRCVRMELGPPDASGRQKPRAIRGSEFVIPAEVVLVAFGFDPVSIPQSEDFTIATNEWGGIVVDANQMTSAAGVFAGGDSTRGPSLAVHAVRDGRRAAAGIHQYLETATAR